MAIGKDLDSKTSEETIGFNMFICIFLPVSYSVIFSMRDNPLSLVHFKYHNIMHKQPLQQNITNPFHFMYGYYYNCH